LLAQVRKVEEHIAESEAIAGNVCAEEHRRLICKSETITEARLAKAKSQVEQSAKVQVGCLREEWRVHEAIWARDLIAAEAKRHEDWLKQETAAAEASEEALMARLTDQEAILKKAAACEMRNIIGEQAALRESFAASRAFHEETSARHLADIEASHRATCEAAMVAELGHFLHEGAEREAAWSQKVYAAEARQHKAQVCASHLEDRGLQLQKNYAATLGGLLSETARLRQETQLLASHNHHLTSPISVDAPASWLPPSDDTNACSPLVGRAINPLDQVSTTASSGVGARNAMSANSLCGGDWESVEPAVTTRCGSSGLGAGFSVQGSDVNPRGWVLQGAVPSPGGSSDFGGLNCSPATTMSFGDRHQLPLDDSVPDVYAKAIFNIERFGWSAMHPDGEEAEWTVLHWVASGGRLQLCARLLQARADPLMRDHEGKTPIDYVLGDGQHCQETDVPNAGNLLLQALEASNVQRQGPCLPILDLAAANALAADTDTAEVPRLLEEAQDLPIPPVYASAIAAVERYGWETVHGGEAEWTALHWAAAEGRAQICERLLNCRADPVQPDNLGRSALDYAHEADDEETLEILLAAAGTDS
jgi:hypothetical protein